MSLKHHLFEIEALNDIFCATEETAREFIGTFGNLYARNPRPSRFFAIIIIAIEMGYKLGANTKNLF